MQWRFERSKSHRGMIAIVNFGAWLPGCPPLYASAFSLESR
jgi:hypothetical protein